MASTAHVADTTGEESSVEGMVIRTDEVVEERDLVGVYLHEISRTPLLDAAKEVELWRVTTPPVESGAEHRRPSVFT